MTVDVATYSPALIDEGRYLVAISRRNTTWAHWQDARELLAEARRRDAVRAAPIADLRPYVQYLNDAQGDYEHAARDLARARVWFRAAAAA